MQQDLVLPAVEGIDANAVQVALIELWLWQAVRKHAIKLQHTPDNIVGARGSSGIREWNGRFSQVVSKLLEARGLRAWLKGDYVTRCEPALRADDARAKRIVAMSKGYCRLLDWLQRDPFENLRNFPLQKGEPVRGASGLYNCQESVDSIDPPRFAEVPSFNYEAAAA